MFEILLTACLASDLANCRTERLPGGETLAECRAAARIGAAGFPPHLEVQSFPCTLAGEEPAFSISQIAPGIFVHKGQHAVPDRQNLGDVSNMGFIIGRDGVMVVDSGSTRKIGDRLLAAIRQETDLPVTHVVLTHAHPDHIYGTGSLLIDAPLVIGHERHKEALQSRGDAYREAMSRMLGDGFEGSVGVAPGRLIDAVSEIDLGDRIVELRPHRTSHTDNDLTVFDRSTGTLFAGDLVFLGHLPALDGSLLGWMKTLDDLRGSAGGRQVVPGHGPVTADWDTAFDATAAYLDQLAEETRSAIRSGTPMLQAIREIGVSAQEAWLLHNEFNARNATAAFKELEWE